jgi:X-X-X-Leu-X-X-Gly heptad repeat protein
LDRLQGGASQLVDGLGRLRGGADTLEERLAEGFQRSEPLQTKLRDGHVEVSVSAARLNRKVDRLRHNSPGSSTRGYFVLSALQGHPTKSGSGLARSSTSTAADQAAQMIVIPRYTFNTPGRSP